MTKVDKKAGRSGLIGAAEALAVWRILVRLGLWKKPASSQIIWPAPVWVA